MAGEVGDSGSAAHSGESSVTVAVSEASHSSAGPVIPIITVTGTDQQPGIDQVNLGKYSESAEKFETRSFMVWLFYLFFMQ